MGVGLVEPVDDFQEDNPASFPALLEHLADEMVRLEFDLREFVRLVVSTEAYQRQAVLHDAMSAAPFRFTGPALKRMTAEQLWDSIEGGRTVATVPQILAMFNGPVTHTMLEKGSVIYDEVTSHAPREAIDVVFLSVLSRRPNAEERALAVQEIMSADDRATGCGNVIWALLNTREFFFIQ